MQCAVRALTQRLRMRVRAAYAGVETAHFTPELQDPGPWRAGGKVIGGQSDERKEGERGKGGKL
eukprot:364354-Chlamydomonas_euryale.AAC.4